MRVVYFGTSPFAVPPLEALVASARHDLVAVVTQPDRPAGRGLRAQPSPVKLRALAHGLPILQPERVRRAPFPAELKGLAPDVLAVVSFGQIIPESVLAIAPHGGVNVHASLLPRWRGAAPIHRALMAGDAETGVATMRMEPTLDTGPIYREARLPIGPDDTTSTLESTLADLGARLLVETLDQMEAGGSDATPQAEEGVVYAHRIEREDGCLDPIAETADALDRRIRALTPRPGTVLLLDGREIKVLHAAPEPGAGSPGTVIAAGKDGIRVATRDGVLRLIRVQPPGKPAMDAADYANGARLAPGATASRPASTSTT